MNSKDQWDVFICYASEDRDAVVRPLALTLTNLGLRVWYDEMELQVGDRLHPKIQEGLAKCRYGIVVLSSSFFAKRYPQFELEGLIQRETSEEDLILPLWRNIDATEISQNAPSLAGRFAVKWEDGLHTVATRLLQVISPELLRRFLDDQRRLAEAEMAQITSGTQLAKLIGEAYALSFSTEDLESENELLIETFKQELTDWMDIWSDIQLESRIEASKSFDSHLVEIHEMGWSVFGSAERRKFEKSSQTWPVTCIAIVQGKPTAVFSLDGKVIISR